MIDLVNVDSDRARIHLHEGQSRAWNSSKRFNFIIAGTQSGKTSFGPWWMMNEIRNCGDGDYLAVTATYDLFKLKMLPEMRKVFCELLTGWVWMAGERVIISNDRSTRIILRSANSPEGLESATAKAAWLDECGQDSFRIESWEAVQRRLSLYQGRVLGTTTPYNLGWLKSEIYDRWRNGSEDIEVTQFKSTMNPQFPIAEYERAKEVMPAWKFHMFYDGEFTRPAGMIYSDFDFEHQVIEPIAMDSSMPRYVGIDFGAVNTALVWVAHDINRDVYYLYRESLSGGKTTQEHGMDAIRNAINENVVLWTAGSGGETQERRDWNSAGVPVSAPSIDSVEAGIDRVIELIKCKRLYVFNTCKGTIDELGTYSRDVDGMGQPTEKIKNKELFHRMDALRYCIVGATEKPWLIS